MLSKETKKWLKSLNREDRKWIDCGFWPWEPVKCCVWNPSFYFGFCDYNFRFCIRLFRIEFLDLDVFKLKMRVGKILATLKKGIYVRR